MLLQRAQGPSSSKPDDFLSDFLQRAHALPYIDEEDSNTSYPVDSRPPPEVLPIPRRSLMQKLTRLFGKRDNDYSKVPEYAARTIDRLDVPVLNITTTNNNDNGNNLKNQSEASDAAVNAEEESKRFSFGLPSVKSLIISEEDDENDQPNMGGAEATASDDPFVDHFNNFSYNCMERPVAVDLGYDDTAKTYWNNDFYNNAKYNAGTPWHELVGMFSSVAIARQQADEEETEANEDSWNPANWNASDVEQAAFFWATDDITGDLIFDNDEQEAEESAFTNLFSRIFDNGFLNDEVAEDEVAEDEET